MKVKDKGRGITLVHASAEALVPADHPLRAVRRIADEALDELADSFDRIDRRRGNASVPPGKVLRALLLQVFYSIRTEQLLIEQLGYNMLYRWFVGLSMDDTVWDLADFSRNRAAWAGTVPAARFFRRVYELAAGCGLFSNERFRVDGVLMRTWCSQAD